MKTKILIGLTTMLLAQTASSEDFNDCSLTCEDQAYAACNQDDAFTDMLCYGAAFWGCMPSCASTKNKGTGIIPSHLHQNLLKYTKCSEADAVPYCGAINTRSEGWYLEGALIVKESGVPAWDHCQKKTIVCERIGSQLEGWYIY
ncbi:MAG: hypothetical protein HYV97_16560 [Bdellovibrio sp.]|nr:hypothetical protein [Bdellovibrio sp.]